MNSLIRLFTRYPRITFLAVLLLTAACLPLLLQVQADTSISSFIPRGDVSYDHKLAIQRIYNINDPLIVDVYDRRTGDIFTPDGLTAVRTVSRFLEELPGVRPGSVRSLDTFDDIAGSDAGFDVRNFLEPFPTTVAAAQKVRERVKAFPLYDGLLVSQDGRRAGIVADFEEQADVLSVFAALEHLRARMDGTGDVGIRVSGPPIVTGTLNVYLNQDALRLDPLAAALTAVLLYLSLRSLAGVLLPLCVMLPSIAAAFASMPLLGFHFTPFSNAIPVVVLSTGIAESVHCLSTYYDLRLSHPELGVREAVQKVFAEVWKPIVMTSVTTVAGFFMMLQDSPMIPVQQFGVTAGIGVMVALGLTLVALPAAIVIFEPKPSAAFARLYATRAVGGPSRWDRLMAWSMGRVIDNRTVAVSFLAVVTVLGVAGLTRLFADYEPVTFFPRNSNVYQDYYAIRDKYLGLNFIEVDIDTGTQDGIYEPDFLNRLDVLQTRIEAWSQVGGTLSIADYLKKMNQAFNADRPEFYRISDSADANAQFFLLFNMSGDPRRFDEVADGARQRANLRVFLKEGNYARSHALIDWLEREAPASFPDARVTLGGEANVIHHWMSGIGADVWLSFFVAELTMFLICIVFMRSVMGAFMLLMPIGIGVLLTYAFIGATGVPVGLGTTSFASIAIGVGVDFSIHYLWRYREERWAGLEHAAATLRAMQDVGKTIVFNGVIVIGGFSVLLLATTTPPQQVGAYVAISIAASLATTFLVLPVAARWWGVARRPLTTELAHG